MQASVHIHTYKHTCTHRGTHTYTQIHKQTGEHASIPGDAEGRQCPPSCCDETTAMWCKSGASWNHEVDVNSNLFLSHQKRTRTRTGRRRSKGGSGRALPPFVNSLSVTDLRHLLWCCNLSGIRARGSSEVSFLESREEEKSNGRRPRCSKQEIGGALWRCLRADIRQKMKKVWRCMLVITATKTKHKPTLISLTVFFLVISLLLYAHPSFFLCLLVLSCTVDI